MAYLLQHLLTERAALAPGLPAVAAGERSLSYEELDRLSNQVARALLAQGVVPGDRVGILAPKSAASVVAVFGVLKAGACYVPLDPRSPAERLASIMRDSGVAVLLADEGTAQRAAAMAGTVPELRCLVMTGPHWGPEGGNSGTLPPGLAVPPPGLAVLPWDAVRAEPDGPLSGTGRSRPTSPTSCTPPGRPARRRA